MTASTIKKLSNQPVGDKDIDVPFTFSPGDIKLNNLNISVNGSDIQLTAPSDGQEHYYSIAVDATYKTERLNASNSVTSTAYISLTDGNDFFAGSSFQQNLNFDLGSSIISTVTVQSGQTFTFKAGLMNRIVGGFINQIDKISSVGVKIFKLN